jgi:hypothetical protein
MPTVSVSGIKPDLHKLTHYPARAQLAFANPDHLVIAVFP